jgi:hypothetical protein
MIFYNRISTRHVFTLLLLICILFLNVSAQGILPEYPSIPTDATNATLDAIGTLANNGTSLVSTAYNLTVQQGLLGAVAMGIGSFMMIFGFKLYKPTLFLGGFLLGVVLGYTLLINIEPSGGWPSRDNVLLFGSFGIGFICES